jgi:hypothetical protein
MRMVLEPIAVDFRDGRIAAFRWRRQTFTVRCVVDTWTWRGRWWQVDSRRTYHLLDCVEGTIEVYTDGRTWTLSRLLD